MATQARIWAAYHIAGLLPADPVDAREVVALALEIVDKVAAATESQSRGARRRAARSKGSPPKRPK